MHVSIVVNIYFHIPAKIAATRVVKRGTMLQAITVIMVFSSMSGLNLSRYANNVIARYATKIIMRVLVFLTKMKTITVAYIIEPTCMKKSTSASSSLAKVGAGNNESIATPILCIYMDLYFRYDIRLSYPIHFSDGVWLMQVHHI